MSDCEWFQDPRTLSAPYIPDTPGTEWWHAETVRQAEHDLVMSRTEGVLVVLMTGRRHDLFSARIKSLCVTKSLEFDLFFFREGHEKQAFNARHYASTVDFKLAVVKFVLSKITSIVFATVYDDRDKHLSLFKTFLEAQVARGILRSYKVCCVLQEKTMQQYMPKELERALVGELVNRCNLRIENAMDQKNHGLYVDTQPVISDRMISESPASRLRSSPIGSSVASTSNIIEAHAPLKTDLSKKASISMFRSKIEMVEIVYFTAIILDASSHTLLTAKFPLQPTWALKAHHMTVSFGEASNETVTEMGGFGSMHIMTVTHFGEIEGRVQAVRITKSGKSKHPIITTNAVPHITLQISTTGVSRDSNDITEWKPVEQFEVCGTLQNTMITDLVRRPSEAQTANAVSVGSLVMKHHPTLKGKSIGVVCRRVEDWMSKTFIENLETNRSMIEWFIQSLDTSDV